MSENDVTIPDLIYMISLQLKKKTTITQGY